MDKLDSDDVMLGLGILTLFFVSSLASGVVSADKTEENYRTICVEQGIAYWEIAADGSTTFKWVHEDGPQEIYSVSP